MSEVVVILDNIRSAHNVGSIFRTADGAGVSQVYLAGITPSPIDRFGRPQAEIEKTSLGATHFIPWTRIGDGTNLATTETVALIKQLQANGFTVVAIEQSPDSISFYEFNPPLKVAYIFGAEVEGVQAALIETSNQTLEVPMQGQKESLNVSVTAGIILFGLQRKVGN